MNLADPRFDHTIRRLQVSREGKREREAGASFGSRRHLHFRAQERSDAGDDGEAKPEAFAEVASGPNQGTAKVGRITFRRTRQAVRIVLPSGRELTYQHVQIEDDEFGRPNISYMGVDPKSKRWLRIRTYGGRLAENVTQAVARDVMAEAMIVLSRTTLIGTVHDELLAEAPADQADAALADMLKVMRTTPAWAPGLPVDAQGWTGARYRK